MYGIDWSNFSLDPELETVWVLKAADDDRARITLKSKKVHGPANAQKEFQFEYTSLKTIPGGSITLDTLLAYYKPWIDPWLKQKAAAAKFGFIWKDAPSDETKSE